MCQPLWTADVYSPIGVNIDGGTPVRGHDHCAGSGLEAFDAAGTTGCSGDAEGLPAARGRRRSTRFASAFDRRRSGLRGASGKHARRGGRRLRRGRRHQLLGHTRSLPAAVHRGPAGRLHRVGGRVGRASATSRRSPHPSASTITQLVAFDATGTTHCSGAPVVCQPLWTATAAADRPGSTPRPWPVGGCTSAYGPAATQPAVLDAFDAAGVDWLQWHAGGLPAPDDQHAAGKRRPSSARPPSRTDWCSYMARPSTPTGSRAAPARPLPCAAPCGPTSTPSSATTPAISLGTLVPGRRRRRRPRRPARFLTGAPPGKDQPPGATGGGSPRLWATRSAAAPVARRDGWTT